MEDEPRADEILNEARGARLTSQEILRLIQEKDAFGDPIAVIVAWLQHIRATQQSILTRLDIIERRLASRG
jgi:hypothetical protein